MREPEYAPQPPPADAYLAKVKLQLNEIQDLIDEMGNLLAAAGRQSIKFCLRIEMDRKTPKGVVEKVNELLIAVNENLE